MKSRLGAPGLSLSGQEGAPLLGARKIPARRGCKAHIFGAPRAGRLLTLWSWWPKLAMREGGSGLVVKAMGGGLDGATGRRAGVDSWPQLCPSGRSGSSAVSSPLGCWS